MAVYVFGAPDRLIVKVGVSNTLRSRASALAAFWRDGEMLYCTNWRASHMDERRVHRTLRPRYWLDGEWFTCGAAVAKSVIRHVVRKSRKEQRALMREHARRVPQRVKQILAETVLRGIPITAEGEANIEAAWCEWEAAGNKRRKLRTRKAVAGEAA